MLKLKRDRPVTLSKTKKKGRGHKATVAAAIKSALDTYAFTFENMRNQHFKEFCNHQQQVMQVALGRSTTDEERPGIHKLSKFLRGDAGLLFTNLPKEEVSRLFEEYEEHDFARIGSIATEKGIQCHLESSPFRTETCNDEWQAQ